MPTKTAGSQLVIVESPAKAKTIERYLGKDFKVLSSFGHIRDLPKKGLNIDIKNNFEPTYAISPDKQKVVNELKRAAKVSTDVWLASDEDREGEAIAWHLCKALNLDPLKTKRIVFHEITKSAIEKAMEKPRIVDINLVDAQQARRILDRLVGYELSPVLWKKVRTGLSAGRVQSVAVRLIVEREREIKDFEAKSSYKIIGNFKTGSDDLKAQLEKNRDTADSARKFLEGIIGSKYTVGSIEQKPGKRSPGAPFTTSTLQQEAARRLGFSVRQTMTLAQRLYENGHISYMRTDSTILSSFALGTAETYIKKNFGDSYHELRQYKTKDQSAQEAHEAIRPTDFNKVHAGDDTQQTRLYDLIWQRALASQMAPATVEKTEVVIDISDHKEKFLAKGEVLQFPGFLKVYGTAKDDSLLPPLKKGQQLDLEDATATETFSKTSARYSEAALVKKLEELGIGRPSTYAPTVSVIQTRGYVEKKDLDGVERVYKIISLKKDKLTETDESEITGADRNKLVPTGVAEVTTDFLVKHFPGVVDYDFTANVEDDFDKIADGKEKWETMIKDFYKSFHPLIEKSADVSRQEVSQARLLGEDPKTGKPIFARFGRYGPMLQRGETEDKDEKPGFAPMPEGVSLEDINLEQALKMFSLPRVVGTTDKAEQITSNIGRFGPYIQVGKVFVSIKNHDPFTVTEDEARTLYAEKQEQLANIYIAEFKSGIKIVNGPYGPYITNGKKNARIDKEIDPKKITEDEAKELLEKAPAKKGFKRHGAKKK
jgi:DNA topoisomerase-1